MKKLCSLIFGECRTGRRSGGSALLLLAFAAVSMPTGCSSGEQSAASNAQTGAANGPQQIAPPHEGAPAPDVMNTDNPTLLAEGEEIPSDVLERKKSRLEEMREKRSTGSDGGASPANVKPFSKPAPDNSVYITSLTDVATEIRQFKDHPVLDKVERISDAKGSRTTAHLRNGRRVNVPDGRIKNLAVASASELLVAAGLPPMPTPTPAPNIQKPNPEKDEIRRKKAEEQPIFPRRP